MIRTVLVASLLLGACDKQNDPVDPGGSGGPSPAPAPAPAPTRDAPTATEARLGPIEIPPVVPAVVAGFAVTRGTHSLRGVLAAIDPFRGGQSHTEAMLAEIDEFVAGRYGVRVSGLSGATMFVLAGQPQVAVALHGVTGVLDLGDKPVGDVGGISLQGLDDGVVAAVVGDALLVGQRKAVEAGIKAAKGTTPRLADQNGALGELLGTYGEDAFGAVAFASEALPTDTREFLSKRGVTHGIATLGPDGLVLAARGDEGKLTTLGAQLDGLFVVAKAGVAQLRADADKKDAPLEILAAIAVKHNLARADELLNAKIENGELVLRVPLAVGGGPVVVSVIGMMSAIAIPAFTKYMRRAKTSEARVHLARMFDSASSYFSEERTVTVMNEDGTTSTQVQHQCPNDGRPSGDAGPTPALSVDCSQGPGGRCVPGSEQEPWAYPPTTWTDNKVWKALGFEQNQGHYFHYNFKYTNTPGEFGACQFTAQAFGDLDGDGIYSTYERAGAADRLGVNSAAGLYIDRELE